MTLDNVSQLPENPVANSPGHINDHKIIHEALKEVKTELDSAITVDRIRVIEGDLPRFG